MLKELTREDWLEMLEIPADRVPDVVMLRGTRNLRRQYEIHAERYDDVLEIGSPNGLFEDVFLANYGSLKIGYASVYGDSMASEITHVFGALGTSAVIQTGCCGGLQPGMQTGDLVIPSRAIPGEGAAQYYRTGKDAPRASGEIQRLAASLVQPCWAYHTGIVYTTSALLAEGREELEKWSEEGYAAVDMETATTFAVAEAFGMDRFSVLFVFDNPLTGDSLVDTGADEQQRREEGEAAMHDVVHRVFDRLVEDGVDRYAGTFAK
jgi:uridine phosphorylase